MLRVFANIATGVVFLITAAFIRYLYVARRMGLHPFRWDTRPQQFGIDVNLLFPHPILYAIGVFIVGVYIGGLMFR
jgi:energy-converting hydrogenase Eha subunit A